MPNKERLTSSPSLFQTCWNKGFPCKLSLGRQHAAGVTSPRAPNPRPHTIAMDVAWNASTSQLTDFILRKPQDRHTLPVLYQTKCNRSQHTSIIQTKNKHMCPFPRASYRVLKEGAPKKRFLQKENLYTLGHLSRPPDLL